MTTTKTNTGPGDPSWETWSKERVKSIIDEHLPTLSTQQAFLIQARDEIFRTGRLDNDAQCVAVIKRLHTEGKHPLNPEITDALDGAWAASEYLRTEAYDREVLAEATDGNLYPDAQTYSQIINRRGSSEGWSLNANGTREQQQRQAAERRQRLIHAIADGKSSYPLFVKVQGQFRWLPVDGLKAESDEVLEKLADVVPQWRAQLSGSRTQHRKQFSDSLGNDVAKVS